MTTRNHREAKGFLEGLVGPLTLGRFLAAIRLGEGWTLEQMAGKLGISRAHLCDLEHGRRSASPDRASRWARILGYDAEQMVQLALQAQLDAAGLKMRVKVKAA